MKKFLVVVLALIMVLALVGCGDNNKEESNKNYIEFTLGPDGTTVQETILHENVITENIITENVITWDDVSTYWD